jgi:hypothetical protein
VANALQPRVNGFLVNAGNSSRPTAAASAVLSLYAINSVSPDLASFSDEKQQGFHFPIPAMTSNRETPAAVPLGEAVPITTTAAAAATAESESQSSGGSYVVTDAVAIPENAAHASQVRNALMLCVFTSIACAWYVHDAAIACTLQTFD